MSGPGGRPPLDPRIRARRAAVTRGQGRRRLRLVVLALVVVGLAVGAWFLLHSRYFSARVVRVVGSVHTPVAEIVSVAGLAGHPPLVDVDPGAAAARLERLPWVSSATVSRHWPDGVVVTVTERRPVAAVATTAPTMSSSTTAPSAGTAAPTTSTTAPTTTTTAPPTGGTSSAGGSGGAWALVDRDGRVLADVATPPAGLVHLVVPETPGAPGSELGPAAAPGLKVAATLPRAFSAQVTAVQVASGGQVSLAMTTPVTVDLGSSTQLHAKYEDVASVLSGAHLVAGDVIDVRVPDSPTVGPA